MRVQRTERGVLVFVPGEDGSVFEVDLTNWERVRVWSKDRKLLGVLDGKVGVSVRGLLERVVTMVEVGGLRCADNIYDAGFDGVDRLDEDRVVGGAKKAMRSIGITDFQPMDTWCSVCGERQHKTPGGASCINGHGGADGVSLPHAEILKRDSCQSIGEVENIDREDPSLDPGRKD